MVRSFFGLGKALALVLTALLPSAGGLPTLWNASDCTSATSKVAAAQFDVENAETYKYLPEPPVLQAARCNRTLATHLNALWSDLNRIQADPTATVYRFKIKGGGLGSVTTYAAVRFSHVLGMALGSGTPAAFDWLGGLHKYSDHALRSRFCPGKEASLSCYFASPIKGTGEPTTVKFDLKAASNIVPPFEVPAKYSGLGMFWYHAQLLSFLLQPNAAMQAAVAKAKAELRWPSPHTHVLGLHIRRGDSCNDFSVRAGGKHYRNCFDIEFYLRWAQRMQRDYGVDQLFLATDSPSYLEMVKTWPGFRVMSLTMPRVEHHKRGHWGFNGLSGEGQQGSPVTDAAQSAALDLLLLAEADYFIGTMSSSLARNAYELMCTRAGHLVPFVSLDAAWCVSWGRNIAVSYHDGNGEPSTVSKHHVLC